MHDTVRKESATLANYRRIRSAPLSVPPGAVLAALDQLTRAHLTCDPATDGRALPLAYDGLPTLNRWLLLARTQGLEETTRGRAAPADAMHRPACFYCNASAGCCAPQGLLDPTDPMGLYHCKACF